MNNQDNLDMEKYVGRSVRWAVASFICSILSVSLMIMFLAYCEMEKPIKQVETIKEIEKPIIIVISNNTIVYPEEKQEVSEVTIDGIEYLEQCVEAEAGNQDNIGKAFVCDVVLNRLDLDKYNSIYEVIDDSGQFQCVDNGNIERVTVSQDTIDVVQKEILDRTNSDILYFRTGKYHSGTEPCFKYQDHYFSK